MLWGLEPYFPELMTAVSGILSAARLNFHVLEVVASVFKVFFVNPRLVHSVHVKPQVIAVAPCKQAQSATSCNGHRIPSLWAIKQHFLPQCHILPIEKLSSDKTFNKHVGFTYPSYIENK